MRELVNEREMLAKRLALTAEICGSELSPRAIALMLKRLEAYPLEAVVQALDRVGSEFSGRLSLAAIVERIDDGRPGPEQAWAQCPKSEDASAWWTAEMRAGFGAAQPLLADGDRVAARMAFLEAYRRELAAARAARRPPDWQLTLGLDEAGRRHALADGVERGLISLERARGLLPYPHDERDLPAALRPGRNGKVRELEGGPERGGGEGAA